MLECSICRKFIHYRCLGISIMALDELINDESAQYACKRCAPGLTEAARKRMAEESSRGNVHFYKRPEPQTRATTQEPSLDDLANSPALMKILDIATQAAMRGVSAQLQEVLERKEKKKNLVAVGFPEQEKSIREQRSADLSKIHDLCDKMDIPRESVRTVFRDGPKNGTGRIMKICFQDGFMQERGTFLREAREKIITDPAFRGLKWKPFIRPDLTYQQRQQDKKLRDELKVRREAGEDVIIRGGVIVPKRHPRDESAIHRRQDSEN